MVIKGTSVDIILYYIIFFFQDLHGRRVRVNYATDRARSGGFGGGGGYGGGGGGYGGGGYGGGGYGGSGGYGGGGYGGGSGGYGGGGDSYGSGGGNYGSGGGGYGGSSGGYGSGGNFSVAGGSDNYVGGAAGSSSGFPSGGGSSFASGGADQLGTNESSSVGDGAGEFSPDEPATEGNYRDDDDEPDDYANRRAWKVRLKNHLLDVGMKAHDFCFLSRFKIDCLFQLTFPPHSPHSPVLFDLFSAGFGFENFKNLDELFI